MTFVPLIGWSALDRSFIEVWTRRGAYKKMEPEQEINGRVAMMRLLRVPVPLWNFMVSVTDQMRHKPSHVHVWIMWYLRRPNVWPLPSVSILSTCFRTHPLRRKKEDLPGREAVQDEGSTALHVLQLEQGAKMMERKWEKRLKTKSKSASMIEDGFDHQTDKKGFREAAEDAS